jgi:membrane protease YdiL (CAAX protease family)
VLLAAGATRALAMGATASMVGEAATGAIVGTGLLLGASAGLGVLLLVARPARRELLALERLSAVQLVTWLAAGAALTAAFDLTAWAMGRPLLAPEWVAAGKSAPLGLLPVALALTSVFEELYLRGFLQGGLARTRLGSWGAIGCTALLLSLLHFPADAWRFFDVLCSGALLGLARHRTGSSLAGMAPHVAGNLKVLVMIALT